MTIRIALGEDSLIVREGIHQVLAVDRDVEIVAAVADQLSLRQACEDLHPDVVISDIRMPPTNTDEGIRLAAELRESHPGIGVVILSQFSDPQYALALLDARSRAQHSPLNELTARELQVLAEIAQGKSNTAIADSLFLTKRAVEKHINAIFWKLGLADAADVSKRVKAALMFLSEEPMSAVS